MKRFLALILTLTIVGTHLNLAVSSHFCMGKKVKSALNIGQEDVSCGMKKTETCDNVSTSAQLKNIPCCADDIVSFDLEEDFSIDHAHIQINTFLGVVLYTLTFIFEHVSETSTSFVQYIHYIPLLIRDIPVLVPSYLL